MVLEELRAYSSTLREKIKISRSELKPIGQNIFYLRMRNNYGRCLFFALSLSPVGSANRAEW
jgi:hypothetical protein